MSPIIRTTAGLAGASAMLVALAACGGIEVVSGSMELNSGATYCRYVVMPMVRGGSDGTTVNFFPIWRNTIYAGQREFQDVQAICVPEDCSVSANDCRNTGSTPVQVETNFTSEPYVLTSIPCSRECSGNLGNW